MLKTEMIGLKSLDLSEIKLDLGAVIMLCKSRCVRDLKLLKLAQCGINSEGYHVLIHSKNLLKLKVLLVPYNSIKHLE